MKVDSWQISVKTKQNIHTTPGENYGTCTLLVLSVIYLEVNIQVINKMQDLFAFKTKKPNPTELNP